MVYLEPSGFKTFRRLGVVTVPTARFERAVLVVIAVLFTVTAEPVIVEPISRVESAPLIHDADPRIVPFGTDRVVGGERGRASASPRDPSFPRRERPLLRRVAC